MKYLIMIIMLVGFSSTIEAQEARYKALFIYKFLQNIEWPEDKPSDKYLVGITDDVEVRDQFTQLVSDRTVNGRSIEVTDYRYGDSLSDIHIVYSADDSTGELLSLCDDTKANNVALITSSEGMASKGSCINFISYQGRVRFEMNLENIDEASLSVSRSIRALAVLVN